MRKGKHQLPVNLPIGTWEILQLRARLAGINSTEMIIRLINREHEEKCCECEIHKTFNAIKELVGKNI
jgi:hypothetical protein